MAAAPIVAEMVMARIPSSSHSYAGRAVRKRSIAAPLAPGSRHSMASTEPMAALNCRMLQVASPAAAIHFRRIEID